jgi:uncharacterized protein GlcG (DUF336 family)
MNGAPVFSLEISERKAYTSALVGLRTADLLALVQPGQPLYVLPTVAGGRFCPMGGGVPLSDDGRVFAKHRCQRRHRRAGRRHRRGGAPMTASRPR